MWAERSVHPKIACTPTRSGDPRHHEWTTSNATKPTVRTARDRRRARRIATTRSPPWRRPPRWSTADLPYASWTGFYRVVAPELLRVGPYQGPVGCLEIPFDRGVCGAAAGERRSQLVAGRRRLPRPHRLRRRRPLRGGGAGDHARAASWWRCSTSTPISRRLSPRTTWRAWRRSPSGSAAASRDPHLLGEVGQRLPREPEPARRLGLVTAARLQGVFDQPPPEGLDPGVVVAAEAVAGCGPRPDVGQLQVLGPDRPPVRRGSRPARTTFSSSRTLPGQEWASSRERASELERGVPSAWPNASRKCSASRTAIPPPVAERAAARPCRRPAGSRGPCRKPPSPTIAARSRWVAATTRTSTGAGQALADPPHLPLLEHAQQHALGRSGQVADLVEEDRAALGGLEDAGPVPVGAGEGAAGVAEEVREEEVVAQGRAVDRHESGLAPRARPVQVGGPPAPCRCRSRPGSAPADRRWPGARSGRGPPAGPGSRRRRTCASRSGRRGRRGTRPCRKLERPRRRDPARSPGGRERKAPEASGRHAAHGAPAAPRPGAR